MADEDVTDLTAEEGEEGSEGGEGGKKKKKEPKVKKTKEEKQAEKEAAKAAKAAEKEAAETAAKEAKEAKAAEKAQKAEARREKRRNSGFGVVIVMLIVALALIGSYVAALVLNVFSVRAITADFIRDPILDFVVWLDPGYYAVDEKLREEAQAREESLNQREIGIAELEDELDQRESRAEAWETQLDRRAVELDELEEEIRLMFERTVPIYRRDMTEEEEADMISYATTFTRMAPADAAEILVRIHTINDVASILYYMSERNAAAIMAQFEPQFAAAVTDVWMYN